MNKKISIEDYTPCRIYDYYLDQASVIEVLSSTFVSKFRLQGIGRMIWLMLDGKNSIRKIINTLCLELSIVDDQVIKNELLTLLSMLSKRNSIVINWDPIYKLHLCQEIE